MTKPIPEGYHTITPTFVVKDGGKAIEFYKRAFGAKTEFLMPGPNGKGVMHADLRIGDSPFMISDENPQNPCKSAETLGASPVSFYIYTEDADAAFKKAVAAGATAKMQVQDMFWGDRMGSVQDPFGYTWSVATRKQNLTPEQIAKGAEAAFAGMASK